MQYFQATHRNASCGACGNKKARYKSPRNWSGGIAGVGAVGAPGPPSAGCERITAVLYEAANWDSLRRPGSCGPVAFTDYPRLIHLLRWFINFVRGGLRTYPAAADNVFMSLGLFAFDTGKFISAPWILMRIVSRLRFNLFANCCVDARGARIQIEFSDEGKTQRLRCDTHGYLWS